MQWLVETKHQVLIRMPKFARRTTSGSENGQTVKVESEPSIELQGDYKQKVE